MTTAICRILLADDHAVLRAGLRMLLSAESDLEVVGEAGSGRQAIAQAADLQPDVVLLDVTMPDMDGLEALPRIRAAAPEARVLVLTMHEDEAYLRQALQAGASGYLVKKAADSELLSAVRAVAGGDVYVHPAMTRFLLEDLLLGVDGPDHTDRRRWESLSEREQQVMRGIALGFSSDEIANRYALSVKTVYTYRTRAMTKLDIQHRSQLVDLVWRLGLLSRDELD